MEGDGDGVQVFVESSWNVEQGSLDECVTVVFLDPRTHEPIISTLPPCASQKLVLVPPVEPVPCEITVKFQGRLCHVQSFYTLSTARICELYSQSKHKTDPDYICTVKGWIPYEDSCISDEGTELVLEAADVTHTNGTKGTDYIQGNVGESVTSSLGSSTVALNPAVDADSEKSVYSSSDDSWVDLKLNGSFTAENACVTLTAPECQSWHVPLNEHELVHLEDQIVLGSPRSKAKDSGVGDDSKFNGCCEVQSKEHFLQGNAQQDMFEAELELIDHSPWAAITIRLLSLQDKSLVEIDQMVFLAVSGPVLEPESPCQSADLGANSLFTTFLPSMLQMARGVSSNGKGQLECENLSQSCEQPQHSPAENLSQSCELVEDMMDKLSSGREEISVHSVQNAVLEEVSVQQDSRDLAAHVHNNAACAASNADSVLNLEEGDEDISQESKSNGTESKRTAEMGEQPFQSGSNVMPSCDCKQLAGDLMAKDLVSTLGAAFSERFDRLESLCLRIESYMQRSFENLDRRIMHLEMQFKKGSEETDCVSASLKQSSISVDASVTENRHNDQESPPPNMQDTTVSDLPPKSECKEGVSIMSTQSTEQWFSKAQDVPKEGQNPIFVDSDFTVAENLVKEAPLESPELSVGPATKVESMTVQNKRPRASLDDAWASALSAFASSFTPVVEVENTHTDLVDAQASGSSCDALKLTLQESEPLGKERNALKETSRCDVDFVTDSLNDKISEAVNAEDGPIYEDCGQAPCDEQMQTAHALPVGSSLEQPDSLMSSHSLNMSTSVPNDSFDFLGFKEMQSTSSKARTEVNHPLEDVELVSMQGFSGLGLDAQCACPLFDVFASADSNSDSKDNLPASRGFKTELSPLFDSTSPEMQDANFLSVGNDETEAHPCFISIPSNKFSQCQENRDFFQFEENNNKYLYNFDDESSTSIAQGLRFSSISSVCRTSKALQTEENEEGIFCNNRASATVDFFSDFILRDQGNVLDIRDVQGPESINSTSFTYCETEEATSFPDVLEEDCSNYQDGRACSEDSLCFSQDFDTCPNDLCDDEWSCAPNVFYLNDPELTDDETTVAVVDVDEKIEMSDISDTDSSGDLPFWPALHNERVDQPQPTTVFPGFENLS